ncbi:hypothetical protein PRZ48_002537 [Zasmidium cellare]|uniref:Uncharacterized protein n=1 Tax=Zasmidium cellare TaxID=395010 RepID=A0ABR0F6S7_ZASCE|nr:hypothetical protein PRZ48_002537 [Zasmidium cellare]
MASAAPSLISEATNLGGASMSSETPILEKDITAQSLQNGSSPPSSGPCGNTDKLAHEGQDGNGQPKKKKRTYPSPPSSSPHRTWSLSPPHPSHDPVRGRQPLSYAIPVDTEKVIEYAQRYKGFRLRDYELVNLPKYDDVTAYKVPEREEIRLWRLEVERLVKAATGSQHILYDSKGKMTEPTPEAFKNVEAITDQLKCNLCIIYHDNALLDGGDKHERLEKRHFNACKRVLETRMSENTQDLDEDNYRRQRPRLLDKDNRELYFSFVDFITAIVARYLYRCGSNSMWHHACFSILAKWATKLKLLEKDPLSYAALSLENADDLDDEKDQLSYIDFLEKKWDPRKEEKFSPASMYHMVESLFRDILFYIVNYALRSPWISDDSGPANKAFEVTTRVYRNGIDASASHTVITSDRDAEFAAANDAKQLRYCRAAIDILLSGAQYIRQTQANAGNPVLDTDDPNTVIMDWSWAVADLSSRPDELKHSQSGHLRLRRMDDVVSMMTANSLAGVHVSMETSGLLFVLRHYLQIAANTAESTDEFVDEDLTAHVNIYNKSFADSKDRQMTGDDFRTLNAATLFDTRMLPGKNIPDSNHHEPVTPKQGRLLQLFRRDLDELDTFRAAMGRTSSWRFDEKAVIVPCRTYVRTCIALSIAIVCGGLAIPFTSRVRLRGVDPFNIASFCWIAVIFFLFLAQSRYVPQWAWHDFLHARVVCRNVTELADVSGLDPQIVLYKLLITEKSTNLHSRGPYNSMFSRVSDDGFSINVPCTTSTLYASGFVLFLGVGKADRHVQVNDARPISEYFTASHRNLMKKCLGVPLPLEHGTQTTQAAHQNVLRLRVDDFEGERILGLFVGNKNFG